MTRRIRLYGEFVQTFGSVLFAVSLFVVWGVLTLIGVVVDQGQDPNVYFQRYAAPIARAILRLNLDNIYHSPWYVGIIGLILLSLAVCTFKRVIPARLPACGRSRSKDSTPREFEAAGMRRAVQRASPSCSPLAVGEYASGSSAVSNGVSPTSTIGRGEACSWHTQVS